MTPIAAFRCSKGAILCADSEVNYGGYAKSPENKITIFGSNRESVRAAITGAGDWESVQEVATHLKSRWTDILGGKDFDLALSQKVTEIYKRSHPEDWGGLTIIGVVWQLGKLARVLRAEDENGARDIYGFTCDGMGISLGRSLAGSFYQPDLSLPEGVSLASYLLYMADKYGPLCSGLGNIFTITDDGGMDSELEWDMQARREFFERLIPSLNSIFLHGPDRDMPSQEFEAEVDEFVESLKRLRKQIELDEYERGKKYGHFD